MNEYSDDDETVVREGLGDSMTLTNAVMPSFFRGMYI
jgi:hypothetical protein